MMTGFAGTYIGAGRRFVAASRFGYLGSSLPPAARPAYQADVYALLLDALGIDRAAVFGYSGGGPSAIQFALRHAGRTTTLILMASALPGKAGALWVPTISSTSRDQAIFVDRATGASLSSYAVLPENDRLW
jgi:pimeloyl-ACP methyl ester carboxylesterase